MHQRRRLRTHQTFEMPPKCAKSIALPKKSEYELLREENIKRNAAFLGSLGLDEAKPKKMRSTTSNGSSSRAPRRTHAYAHMRQSSDEEYGLSSFDAASSSDSSSNSNRDSARRGSKRRRGEREVQAQARLLTAPAPTRRSSRQAAQTAHREGEDESPEGLLRHGHDGTGIGARASEAQVDHFPTRRKVTAASLRSHIERANPKHSNLISNEAVVHCVHRLTSMSEKALGNRVRTISRAGGKNAKEKLLCFFYGLTAAGLGELSDVCRGAVDLS